MWGGEWKRCIPKEEVAEVLHQAHDKEGHFAVAIMTSKLKKYYWPKMVEDIKKYLEGCLVCARHGIAQRSQTQSPIYVDKPNVLFGMDFIGPFPEASCSWTEALAHSLPQFTKVKEDGFTFNTEPFHTNSADAKFTHILLIVDYASRFVWAFPTVGDTQDEVIRCLSWLFGITGPSIAAYTDRGKHFGSSRIQDFLFEYGIIWIPSPVAAKKATGLSEKCNDLLQRILKKIAVHKHDWPLFIQEAVFELNRRVIPHLGFSPYQIYFGFQPVSKLSIQTPDLDRMEAQAFFAAPEIFAELDESIINNEIVYSMLDRDELRNKASELSDAAKVVMKEKHDMGVRGEKSFFNGQLVMLYDHRSAKKSFILPIEARLSLLDSQGIITNPTYSSKLMDTRFHVLTMGIT